MRSRSTTQRGPSPALDQLEVIGRLVVEPSSAPVVDDQTSRSAGFPDVLREAARMRAEVDRSVSTPKRVLDVLGALTGLIVLAPFFAVISLALLVSGQRVLFVHHRLGVGGTVFPCLKFRSMYPDAEDRLLRLLATDAKAKNEWLADQKITNDPRVTRLGGLLRRTNLDELPQLLNVLVGHMSLVGPRPIVVTEVVRYGTVYPTIAMVRPGLTGLWQVSGRHRLSYERRVELDLQYVRTTSLRIDLAIIARTIAQTLLALVGSRRFGGV